MVELPAGSEPFLLHERFDQRADRLPRAVALYDGDDAITYGELRARSGRIAADLRHRGIRPGHRVGLHVDRSIDWVSAILGVLRTGAAVVPLHPADPEKRLRSILDRGELAALIDSASTRFPGSGGLVHDLAELVDGGGPDAPTPSGDPESAAFVLSSSGSTGRPKMIVRSHRSFGHRLRWTWSRHPFGADALGCQKAHPSTTHAVYELFEPLLAGAPTLIVRDAEVRDLERFWELVRGRRVTRLLIVPSALRASLELPGFAAPPLEVVVLMGEAVHRPLVRRALEAFAPETHLYSIYGSTEASSSLVCDLRRPLPDGEDPPLGEPLTPDVRAFVLDEELRPVPPGRTGRLFLAGTPLFAEYLNDRAATEAVLRRVPGEAGRAYDTRDDVRLHADRSIEFVGRVDDVVKIRGFRVDLGEVERVLQEHPSVREAAVVARTEPGGERGLIGFFAPAEADRSAVYDGLRDRLPAYMVPSVLVGLERLPTTASGKVDRIRLLEHGAGAAEAHGESAFQSTMERRLAAVWREALGHAAFGPDSAFFEVGGTSLSVFTLVRLLRASLADRGAAFSASWVYRHPTLAAQAGVLEPGSPAAGDAPRADASVLVTLRQGSSEEPPLFLIASAGGTLGAYAKLAQALSTERSLIGVRDPFILDERDPSESFAAWVGRYVEAIRERQPTGPWAICAYSSAGAFGYEIARQLRADGGEVSLLALIDPQALDRGGRGRFGYWTLQAIWMRPLFRRTIRLLGGARSPAVRVWARLKRTPSASRPALSREEWADFAERTLHNREHLASLSSLLELNTGLPFAMEDAEFEGAPSRYLDLLAARIHALSPDFDLDALRRIVVQYELQVRAQHAYELAPYRGRVLLVEPRSPHAGLIAALLAPYVPNLTRVALPLGPPDERTARVTRRFGRLASHYRCMRDDAFVRATADALDAALL